jgi:hypothetical protein
LWFSRVVFVRLFPNDSPHRTLDWADWLGHFRVSLAPVSSMTLCRCRSFIEENDT